MNMMILTTICAAVLLIGIGIVGMCMKIILKKGGRFPSGHVHDIPALKKRDISCASGQH